MAKYFINIDGNLSEIGKGNSAYDIAVYNGFEGTEQEWLESINGKDGSTVSINPDDNHWYLDGIDTGIVAEGIDGNDGITPTIGNNNHWFIGETDTNINAKASIVTIGTDNNWYIDGINQGIKAKGEDGKSIRTISKDDNNNLITTFTDGTTEILGQLNIDVSANFLTNDGFGNLRYYNGKFQYYDTSTATWIDSSVDSNNVYIIKLLPNTMERFIGIYNHEIKHNQLKWIEPKDTIIDGQVICTIEKVVIKRKLGEVPLNIDDGELVIELKRNQFGSYIDNWYTDDTFSPNDNEIWYYKAFPVSTIGFVNESNVNEASISCKDHYLFGFKLDQNESDPTSMITYIEDNENFNSAYMNYTSDIFNYGDWKDFWFIRDIKPCMLTYDGTVAYELDRNDYSLKVDGSASDIADASFEGNVMIGFPKTYWKIVDNGDNTANIYFSDKKINDDFTCWSHIDNNGNEIDYCYMPVYNGYSDGTRLRSLSNKIPISTQTADTEISLTRANNLTDDIIWYTEVFCDRQLVNLLLILIGKSTNTQSIFGNGNVKSRVSNSNTGILNTGSMNEKGLFWGNQDNISGVKVFGIEHWWGNQFRRIAGWIYNCGNQMIKMTYGQSDGSTVDGYNTDGIGYIDVGLTISGTSGGYISKISATFCGLVPILCNGSSSTYYTDSIWFDNSQSSGYAFVGGDTNNGLSEGALCSSINHASSRSYWNIGASISCKPLAN